MGTIANKLTYLNETKTAIKNAIITKGVSVTDEDTFRDYADKITAIETGGGGDFTEAFPLVTTASGTFTEITQSNYTSLLSDYIETLDLTNAITNQDSDTIVSSIATFIGASASSAEEIEGQTIYKLLYNDTDTSYLGLQLYDGVSFGVTFYGFINNTFGSYQPLLSLSSTHGILQKFTATSNIVLFNSNTDFYRDVIFITNLKGCVVYDITQNTLQTVSNGKIIFSGSWSDVIYTNLTGFDTRYTLGMPFNLSDSLAMQYVPITTNKLLFNKVGTFITTDQDSSNNHNAEFVIYSYVQQTNNLFIALSRYTESSLDATWYLFDDTSHKYILFTDKNLVLQIA